MIKILKKMVDFLPLNWWGNWIYYRIYFTYSQGRYPKKSRLLVNDFWFHTLVSDEIYDIFRQITTDKELSKHYVNQRIKKDLCTPTLQVIEDPCQLGHFVAEQDCVLKPAHGSQLVVFLKQGDKLSPEDQQKLTKSFYENIYHKFREGNYRFLRPRVIVEPMLTGPDEIVDYKFFCRNGKPKIIQVDLGRHTDHKQGLYTPEWRSLNVVYAAPNPPPLPQPRGLEEMLELASIISTDFSHVRVDFFYVNNKIFIGELTHVPNRSFCKFATLDDEKIFSRVYFSE